MNWQDGREAWLRLAGLFQRRRHERDLADELEFHIAMKKSAGQSAGQANREFGGLEKWKEVCRDVGRWRLLEDLVQDLFWAARMLRKSPAFTAVAIVTLTLAIGANTAIFSLLNELMLKSVPVPNASRLAILRVQPERAGYTFSYPLLQSIEEVSKPVMNIFAFSDRLFNLRTAEGLEPVAGQLVSGQYFAALGVRPQLGGSIEARGVTALVTDGFWRNRMGGTERAIGQKLILNERIFTVVGVMPKEFRGMSRDRAPEVFIPLEMEPLVDAPFSLISVGNRAWWLSVGGLLADGVSLEQASVFLRGHSRQLFESLPPTFIFGPNGPKASALHIVAEPGANGLSSLRLRFSNPLRLLMGLVALVLLIACLNLATLMNARAAARSREISTRLALGASRARLVRQLLTESLLLSFIGAGLGLAMAPGLAHFVGSMLTPQAGPNAVSLEMMPDLTVFAFTALLAILATALVGTLPALHSTMREASSSIRGAERRYWWPRLLLAMEVALSLVLATGASLLGYSLVNLRRSPLGFDPRGLIVLNPQGKQPILEQRLLLAYKQAVEEIQRLPNVEHVSLSATVPMSGAYIDDDIQALGGPKLHFQQNAVGPEYFKTLGTPLLGGREFRWADRDGSERKVILNSSAARLLFPGGRIVGRRVVLQDGKTQAEVVGLVADTKGSNLRDADPPTVYSPALQSLIPRASLDILIRTRGSAAQLVASARRIAMRAISDIPSPGAISMQEAIAESLATERIMSTLALFFGGLSLLITGIGLYGTLAYSTERRTGEIGIRVALGAQRTERHLNGMH